MYGMGRGEEKGHEGLAKVHLLGAHGWFGQMNDWMDE